MNLRHGVMIACLSLPLVLQAQQSTTRQRLLLSVGGERIELVKRFLLSERTFGDAQADAVEDGDDSAASTTRRRQAIGSTLLLLWMDVNGELIERQLLDDPRLQRAPLVTDARSGDSRHAEAVTDELVLLVDGPASARELRIKLAARADHALEAREYTLTLH